ncbi:MAG: GNAT family N-acetyltransferase [Candidatus ainarchaeum sp.]|nr:GNAT family N-acetyltransferase [Candidatus ainarchaeum sp.]
MKLIGERIFLRPWKKSDVPRIVEICKDKTISKFTHVPFPYTRKHAVQFIKNSFKQRKEKSKFAFAIVLKEKNLVIGAIGLTHYEERDRRAEVGYWLAKEFRGKEIVPEAAEILLDFGFNKLKLHRIQIDCAVKNSASKRVIEKLGFEFECRQKERGFLGGKFVDTFSFAILDRKFFKGKKK